MHRIQAVCDSITNAQNVIGMDKWKAGDFPFLKNLTQQVQEALNLNEYESYHRLACLRSWLFWVELRGANNGLEDVVVTGLFYALVLAILPIFPPRYMQSISNVCTSRIQATVQAICLEFDWIEQESFLTGVVSSWGGNKEEK